MARRSAESARAAAPVSALDRRPERWQRLAGSADVATLTVPPDAYRDRVFEIDCRCTVRLPVGVSGAWHELQVSVDGAREWLRRVDTANPGATDSLELHLRRVLPQGRAMKIEARVRCQGAQRVDLRIEVEENP